MLTDTSIQVSASRDFVFSADALFDALTTIRKEWEATAEGESLLHCHGSVGLLLFDIVAKLDVPVAEQCRILGFELHDEVMEFVTAAEK